MGTPGRAPLVVTLALPDEVQEELDALRRRWFPSGRTAVGAHLTLFHAVPGELEDQVRTDLTEVAGAGPVALRLTGVMSLGRGAAYAVDSPDLARRHDELQRTWWSHLTRQDQQRLRAHVTLQNKVDPAVARATVEALRTGFSPSEVEAPGFDLWRYDGGPWTHLVRVTG
ncbi:MAG: 2'-5' RNA ligase family protein [Janthinobacterium lividum]